MLSPILSVHDIDASVDFYMQTLGFTHGFGRAISLAFAELGAIICM